MHSLLLQFLFFLKNKTNKTKTKKTKTKNNKRKTKPKNKGKQNKQNENKRKNILFILFNNTILLDKLFCDACQLYWLTEAIFACHILEQTLYVNWMYDTTPSCAGLFDAWWHLAHIIWWMVTFTSSAGLIDAWWHLARIIWWMLIFTSGAGLFDAWWHLAHVIWWILHMIFDGGLLLTSCMRIAQKLKQNYSYHK